MKKIIYTILGFLGPTIVLAADTINTQVTLLQGDLPNIGEKTNLASYVSGAFTLAMAVGAGIAFVMITYGGIIYATADAISGKQNGKKYIKDAVSGLIILLGAFAILNTIDPELVNLNIGFKSPDVKTPPPPAEFQSGGAGSLSGCPQCTYRTVTLASGRQVRVLNGYVMSPDQIASDSYARATLERYITPNNSACVGGGEIGCTNLNNLPGKVVSDLITMGQECQCKFTLTGGTEGGHSEHGPGLSAVDLSTDSFRSYLNKLDIPLSAIPNDGQAHPVRLGSVSVMVRYEPAGAGRSTGDHYHLVF